MSSTALKTLALVMIVAAAILGFVAWQFSQGLTEAPEPVVQQPSPDEDRVFAVVATQRIPAYEPITQEAVDLVPISVEPPQYYSDISEVVGRTPLRGVPIGAPVTQEAFSSAQSLARAIPAGTQAMSLEISDVIAVGGFVKPGDIVDVLVYVRSSGDEVEDSQARVLLENTRLLAYEERLINASADSDKEDSQRRRQRTAVLAVPEKLTTRVMLGASLGELRLALRGAEQPPSLDAGTGEERPEAVAPVAQNRQKAKEKEQDDKEKYKVVTLEELTEIEKKQKKRRAPPQALIEVFQGSDRERIYRQY